MRLLGLMVRLFQRDRVGSLGAVLTIALTVGLSGLLFAIADAAYFHPLPYPDPDRLVSIEVERTNADGRRSSLDPSVEQVREWRGARDVIASSALFRQSQGILERPVARRVRLLRVTEEYLDLLGISPRIGRGITAADADPGVPSVVLLSTRLSAAAFDSKSEPLGAQVVIDGEAATVVGVLPADFNDEIDVMLPFQRPLGRENARTGSAYARLRPNVTPAHAAEVLSDRMRQAPASSSSFRMRATSLLDESAALSRTPMILMAVMSVLILLIACFNVAALMLAGSESRMGEFAVRRALGASGRAIWIQTLAECGAVTLVGGALGVLVAWWAIAALSHLLPIEFPENSVPRFGGRATAFVAFVLISVTLAVGALPAVRNAKNTGLELLAGAGRGTRRAISSRFAQIMVGAEAAIAVVLTVTAALMLLSLTRLYQVPLGFDPSRLAILEVQPLGVTSEAENEFYGQLLAKVRSRPEIVAAGAVDNFVLRAGLSVTVARGTAGPVEVAIFQTMPGYLQTLGARLEAGSLPPTSEISAPITEDWTVITAAAARRLFPNEMALGQLISSTGLNRSWRVMGVINDVKVGGPRAPLRPVIFTGRTVSNGFRPFTLVYRTDRDYPELAQELRTAAELLRPNVLIGRSQPARELLEEHVNLARRRAVASVVCAGVGFLLSMIGMAGISAYLVARRRREFGIRIACGAPPSRLVLAAIRTSGIAAGIGLLIGLAFTFILSKSLATFMFGVQSTDPVTYTASALAILVAAIAAATVPAAIGARRSPVSLLRD